MELELLLEREPWRQALANLQGWGGLALLDAQLQQDCRCRLRLVWAQRLGLPLLTALLAGAAEPLALAHRLHLPRHQVKLLSQFIELRLLLAEASPSLPSAWCALLETPGLAPQAVALAIASGVAPRRPLLHWYYRWRHLKSPLSAEQLIQQELLRPGPQLGERLRQLRAERLDELGQSQSF